MVNDFDMSEKFHMQRREGKFPPMKGFHSHQIHELVLVENGESAVLTQNSVIRAKGAYIIFYPAGVSHHQLNNFAEGCVRRQLNYSDSIIESLLPADSLLHSLFVLTLDAAQFGRLRDCFELLFKIFRDEASPMRTRSLALLTATLVNEISTMLGEQTHDGEQRRLALDRRIREICIYINSHYGENITLEHITSRFFISRAQLVRLFKQTLGVTVNEYLTDMRISQARIMLSEGCQLSDVAQRCGFSNTCYFIKVFRREVGVTPAKFRASFRAETALSTSDTGKKLTTPKSEIIN